MAPNAGPIVGPNKDNKDNKDNTQKMIISYNKKIPL